MSALRPSTPALLWIDPAQVGLMAHVAAHANLDVIAVGCPSIGAPAPDLASAWPSAQRFDDLRQAIASAGVKVVLLGTSATGPRAPASDPPSDPLDDAQLARLCRLHNSTLLTLEPMPASLLDVASFDSEPDLPRPRALALLRDAPIAASLRDSFQTFGTARTMSLSMRCRRAAGTLGARLFDAMLFVQSFMGVPDAIDASIVTRSAASGVYEAPGESLRRIRGDLTAHCRFGGSKAAAITLSDRAGRWFRGVTVLGEQGCIRVEEDRLERVDLEGQIVERSVSALASPASEPPSASSGSATGTASLWDQPAPVHTDHPDAVVLAAALARALDRHAPRPEPIDLVAVLSMCESAILSARTGQPESPATLSRMLE